MAICDPRQPDQIDAIRGGGVAITGDPTIATACQVLGARRGQTGCDIGGPCNGRLVNIQTPPQGGTYVFNVHTRVWSRPMSCGPGNAPTSSTICRSKNKHGQISRIKTRRVTDQMIGVSSALTTTILPGRPREERSSRTSRDDVLALRVRR